MKLAFIPYRVGPSVPPPLACLKEMAFNLLWTWDAEIREVFRRLDRDLWEETCANPVLLLGRIDQERLEEAAANESYLAYLERSYQRFRNYFTEKTWWEKTHGREHHVAIAYFSAEYGLTACLPIYSGGLGILAGDHLKTASDLGLPLVGVGLLYQGGYFRQYLNVDGWQQESYPVNDFYNLPVEPVVAGDGHPVEVEIPLGERKARGQVWRAQVGRIPLYLLDTNTASNPDPGIRDITDQLYGGDSETRIRQELILGIGGLRALHQMGIRPMVCHLNEGHSAFLTLERIRLAMLEHTLSFREALEATSSGNIFTTHTPVPAGFDHFTPELMQRYLGPYAAELGISIQDLCALGRADRNSHAESFNMAALAIQGSRRWNAVSRLHCDVSRPILQPYMPEVPLEEIPLATVTNGIHFRSWISAEMATLFDRYLGSEWWRDPAEEHIWERVEEIPDEELWGTHERRRQRLVAYARRRLVEQCERRGASTSEKNAAREVLDTRALTIGFARRFALYKRGALILRDPERLRKILNDPQRPVQFLIAGKAHPRDNEGKDLIRQLVQFGRREESRRRMVFLEDYDMTVARYLVQGVDLWLNNPRRLMEASGTSGMKVLPNGGLNMSVLDGWWAEAYRPEVGWAIGSDELYDNLDYQDRVESNALYDLLEREVVPLYYDRGPDGLPHGWIAKMKQSMRWLCPVFSTNRMALEYVEKLYLPASRSAAYLAEENMAKARELARWKAWVAEHWSEVQIGKVEVANTEDIKIRQRVPVRAEVDLGALNPRDVDVQIYYGPLGADSLVSRRSLATMRRAARRGPGAHVYTGEMVCTKSGLHGFTVRVLPRHRDALLPGMVGLIRWK